MDITSILKTGVVLRGFRSGGGLRVILIETLLDRDLVGYGEYQNVEGALAHAVEDFEAGHRPYNVQYGKIHDHYFTGSNTISSPLDGHLHGGGKLRAEMFNDQVLVTLYGYNDLCELETRTGLGQAFEEAVMNALASEPQKQ